MYVHAHLFQLLPFVVFLGSWSSVKMCSHPAVLENERNPFLRKWVVVPYYFAHNRLPCWPHVPYYNTMNPWKSCMWNPRNNPVWLLGSKMERVFLCAARRHFIRREAETRKVMPSLILDSEVITMHLILSPLIMQYDCKKQNKTRKASWVLEDDCLHSSEPVLAKWTPSSCLWYSGLVCHFHEEQHVRCLTRDVLFNLNTTCVVFKTGPALF